MWGLFFDVVQQLFDWLLLTGSWHPSHSRARQLQPLQIDPVKWATGSEYLLEYVQSTTAQQKMLICNKSNTCTIASRQEGPAFESTVGVFLHGVCLSFPSLCGFTPTPSQSPKNMHGVRLTGDSKDANVSMNGRLRVGPVTLKTDRWVHTGFILIL